MPATLSLKEVPAETHRTLKERAARNHRSLNSEILAILEAAVKSQKIETDEYVRRARALRSRFTGKIDDAELQAAKRTGRA
ncbi:MAG TPA: Arc family DNA-binding protein [Turneriella sp.]|mgnify:FL=1|nr:Arc family DNA-binding protein [Turneriella sp.]HNA79209.1 Arc family DNA-binding protein [Turneriella sp.]HNE21413.1 Arc family DNA-binding protein [Turneriella sp.]HNL10857.1 Arc family DNA-binding protein [Turneriella sp.]HNL54487.1 Arc family DNA-binding protein [Turneriella sp.]